MPAGSREYDQLDAIAQASFRAYMRRLRGESGQSQVQTLYPVSVALVTPSFSNALLDLLQLWSSWFCL